MFNTGFTFKQYFENYKSFRDVADNYGVISGPFDFFFFQRLFRQYANWETAYDTPHDFFGAFFNKWEDKIEEMGKKKEIADLMYKLQESDYIKDFTISTFAQNPNTNPMAPSELLKYFNTQAYSENNMKRVEALARAFQLVPRYVVADFVKSFAKLFQSVILEETYLYKGGF